MNEHLNTHATQRSTSYARMLIRAARNFRQRPQATGLLDHRAKRRGSADIGFGGDDALAVQVHPGAIGAHMSGAEQRLDRIVERLG